MSEGFSADWLALREPVDHASVNALLRKQVADHFAGRGRLTIVDLGAGAGSNLRGLSPWLPAGQSWRLVDNDLGLLERAIASAGQSGANVEAMPADLKNGDLDRLIAGADLVTSSAFFDLASQDLADRLAQACAAIRVPFYTVLTYDGIAAWLPEHPADADMRRLFNAHQQTDKGLGPALGPGATVALEAAFAACGYVTSRAPSPWIVGSGAGRLRHGLEQGWADAVAETGGLDQAVVESWRQFRLTSGTVAVVGHEDFWAVPA